MTSRPRQPPRDLPSSKVVLEVPDTDIGIVDSLLEDVSSGGMRVRAPVALPVGHRVLATIFLSGSRPIVAMAEVLGVRECGHGRDHVAVLRFTLMAPAHRAHLTAALELPAGTPLDARRDALDDPTFVPRREA